MMIPESQNNVVSLTQTKPSFWYNPRVHAILFQSFALISLIGISLFIIDNTLTNLEQRGISTGFDFLSREAGFGILQTLITYSETSHFSRTFWVGLLNTLLVSILGIIFATILGFIIGIARLSSNWLVNKLATTYVEIFRNIPLLLQIFFWYGAVLQTLPSPQQSYQLGELVFLNIRGLYLPKPVITESFIGVVLSLVIVLTIILVLIRWGRIHHIRSGKIFPIFWLSLILLFTVPTLTFISLDFPLTWELAQLKGFNFVGGITLIPELTALLFGLSIYTAAFIAEVVRAGILSVNQGQREAANSLGLKPQQTLRLIIIPQAMRVTIPPLTNQYLNLIKNSSLATAIGYPDLVAVFAGTTLNQTGQAIEVMSMTMAVYLLLSLLTSLLMNSYNARLVKYK